MANDCDTPGPHTNLPYSFEQRFKQLVDDLENATGKIYTLTVREFGANTDQIIKPFEKRDGYRVYNMAPGYEALEGVYKTPTAISKKLEELRCSEVNVANYHTPNVEKDSIVYKLETITTYPEWAKGEPHLVFKCAKCGKSDRNHIDYSFICQHCPARYYSKWDHMGFNLTSGTIFKSGGGS